MTRRALVLLALLAPLAGCGFHLRGQGALPDGWSTVAVRDVAVKKPITGHSGDSWYATGRDQLHHSVEDALEEAGFTVDDDAPIAVELLDSSIGRRAASLDASATAAEYQLDYNVGFRVTGRDGAVVVAETTLHTDNTYRFNADAVLGSSEQEEVMYAEMRRDIARRIVDQLRRKAAASATPVTTASPQAQAQAPATVAAPAQAPAPARTGGATPDTGASTPPAESSTSSAPTLPATPAAPGTAPAAIPHASSP